MHFTAGSSTTALMKAAVNASDTNKCVTMSLGTDSDTWTANNVQADTSLTDADTYPPRGEGWTAAKTAVGTWQVTFDSECGTLESFVAGLQLNAVADKYAIVGSWNNTTKVLTLYIYDKSDAALADPQPNANNRLNFMAVFSREQA